jgi:bifunctional UDP-N-acetylglucosamine pyrophosphorylase / glucosamine-1-phosphate N-acetyltransferase
MYKNSNLEIVILAAGRGTRMHSSTPKILHKLAGISLLERVINTALILVPDKIHVVVGFMSDLVIKSCAHLPVNWVLQNEQLGTGHAVKLALSHIADSSRVLVLSADVPLIAANTLHNIAQHDNAEALNLLVANMSDPYGLGRIIRESSGNVKCIVEERDADENTRAIQEIYTGICSAPAHKLKTWVHAITPNNQQQEYYLTDVVHQAAAEQYAIVSTEVFDAYEIQGVNDKLQLHNLERYWQHKLAQEFLRAGVSIADAERFDLRGNLVCGQDVFIDVNNVFLGDVRMGNNCIIEANCILQDVILGDNVHVRANSIIESSTIGHGCNIGPFARIRPGSLLAENCKIGNFVEIKNTKLGQDSKAAHLSYLGDAEIGAHVNIGAGVITCNYDGFTKHKTTIADGVKVGAGTEMVAPIIIAKGATIGAGSTLRDDVPANSLAVSLKPYKLVKNWVKKLT